MVTVSVTGENDRGRPIAFDLLFSINHGTIVTMTTEIVLMCFNSNHDLFFSTSSAYATTTTTVIGRPTLLLHVYHMVTMTTKVMDAAVIQETLRLCVERI